MKNMVKSVSLLLVIITVLLCFLGCGIQRMDAEALESGSLDFFDSELSVNNVDTKRIVRIVRRKNLRTVLP